MRMLRRIAVLLLVAATSPAALHHIDIQTRADVPGTAYERIVGRAYFAVDPSLAVIAARRKTPIRVAVTPKKSLMHR